MLAAARVRGDWDCIIDRRFNAQVWIVCWVAQYQCPWQHEVGLQLSSFIEDAWMNETRNRFRLRNPIVTAPEIERECHNRDAGLSKAARILLAAAGAVTTRISGEIATQLRALGSQKFTDPYRFA